MARENGLAIVDPSYFSTPHRLAQLREVQAHHGMQAVLDHDATGEWRDGSHRFGTVGAVARADRAMYESGRRGALGRRRERTSHVQAAPDG